jgi:hypothetical protein
MLSLAAGVSASLLLCLAGCSSPSRANIELRKQNQQLQVRLAEAEHQREADQRVIAGLREQRGVLPTLPPERLARLFTTQGLAFGRLTGGADINPKQPGDEGLALYLEPVDGSGQVLKAAGSFDIDAFDLAEPNDPLIGHWHFTLDQAKNAWNGLAFVYSYALICPWQRVPKHEDITVKATFFDELTQTPFHAQQVVHIVLPPQATTQPVADRR